jgi:hypothetical protein
MRRWANFFKHPKDFGWIVHHPSYHLDGSGDAPSTITDKQFKIIDDAFLKKYYCAERTKGLAKEFTGFQKSVVVILPDVESVINGICDSLANFVDVVTKNPVYYEVLHDEATITNFYETGESATNRSAMPEDATAPQQQISC